MTDRRSFMRFLAGGLLATPRLVSTQQPAMPVIGFVRSSSFRGAEHLVDAFRLGLQEAGYIEGRNVAIEFRSADDQYEKLPALITELIRRPAAVLVANAIAAQAAKAATTTVPIVFATGGDPVEDDQLVTSFSRPGGNITGVTFLANTLGAKKLELLRDVVPKARMIGVLENPNGVVSRRERMSVLAAAQTVGQGVVAVTATRERDFDGVFTTLAHEQAGALLVTGDALFTSRRNRLLALAARHAMPMIHSEKLLVQAGALMSYGPSVTDAYRHVGIYAGRILKGEKPADLPVIQSTKFELVINLKTAKTLGLTIPPVVLARTDEIIE